MTCSRRLLFLLLPLLGCGDGNEAVAPPGTEVGEVVRISVRAEGLLPDDAVTIVVDGIPRGVVAPWAEGEIEVRLLPGPHGIELADVAGHCEPLQGVVEHEVSGWAENSVVLRMLCRGTGAVAGLEFVVVRAGQVWVGKGESLRFLAHGRSAAWSPDGERIAVADRAEITAVELDGGAPPEVLVPDDGWWVGDPAWSPDGKRLAFSWCGEPTDIFGEDCTLELRLATKGAQGWAISAVGADHWTPAWSPDGTLLAAAGYRSVHLFGPDGTTKGTIQPAVQPDQTEGPSFSPDGTRLAYLVWPKGGSGQKLRVRDLNSAEDREIPTPWATGIWSVAWLPNGGGLILGAHLSSVGAVCLFWTTESGDNPRPLLPCGELERSFRLRPVPQASPAGAAGPPGARGLGGH